MDAIDQLIPPSLQVHGIAAVLIVKLLAEAYSSIRAGGGLKRVLMSFWFGEQIPKVIANDYKPELSKPPFPPVS